MSEQLRPALFLDRDGVINEEVGYLHRIEDVRLVPGAAELLHTANRLGLPVIVITNQAGIGRGLYTDAEFHTLMDGMRAMLQAEDARIDAVYYSPFHPEHGLGAYRRDTDCRKPKPGMLLRAAAEHGLDLTRSVLVGDRCSDLQAGFAAGVLQRFLLGTTEPAGCSGIPHTVIADLGEVVAWLRRNFASEHSDTASEASGSASGVDAVSA